MEKKLIFPLFFILVFGFIIFTSSCKNKKKKPINTTIDESIDISEETTVDIEITETIEETKEEETKETVEATETETSGEVDLPWV